MRLTKTLQENLMKLQQQQNQKRYKTVASSDFSRPYAILKYFFNQ